MGHKINIVDINLERIRVGSVPRSSVVVFVCYVCAASPFLSLRVSTKLIKNIKLFVRPPIAGKGLDSFYFSDWDFLWMG